MSLFEDTNPKKLSDLLGEIDSRTMALPDFQRDFVWDPSATQELIVSIANGYPAGSLLRVRDKKHVFAARAFEGAPELDGQKHTFLVLDGQQRLTSLFQAFYGAGDHRYFLDLKLLMNGKDFEEAIFHERSNSKRAKELQKSEIQKGETILPLSILRKTAGSYHRWLYSVTNDLPNENRLKIIDALEGIYTAWIQPIDEYQFPVVTLSDETEPDALCTIFETLNRTGVKLSVFELLTARFWPLNVKLRDLWDESTSQWPIIKDYDVDPYYLLQAISLICRQTPSCKRKDILALEASDIVTWWNKVAEGFATGLKFLRDNCGVVSTKWVPYQTMLTPLSAVLAKLGTPHTPEFGARLEQLKRWFWCAVFGQHYESSPNSQSAKDYSELVSWLTGAGEPESVATIRFDPKTLRDATPRQRAIYRGAVCLIVGSGGARDFHTQAVITSSLIEQEGIDDHHIFPAAYLEKKKGITESRRRDCVLNRTLIDRATNHIISDRAPSDYLSQMKNTPNFPFDFVLKSHCLPIGENSPLMNDDYDEFINWREAALWAEIQKVTGLQFATNLQNGNGASE
jgi:hypothetical protein